MQLRDVLLPKHVDLNLTGENRIDVVAKLLQDVRGDSRVSDSAQFAQAFLKQMELKGSEMPVLEGGLWIPHLRTDLVDRMVMAFGRTKEPLENGQLRFVLLVAVPHAMASEYLRLVGGVCRVFRSRLTELENATDSAAVIRELSAGQS